MKTAIFGGSFDPVHLGHIEVVKKALSLVDKVIVVPNYLNPLKNSFSAPPELRLKWLQKVFADMKNVEISPFEIEKNRPVYSIETIEHFKPDFFIIGSDNLKTLNKWHKIDEILKKTKFIVASRGEIDTNLAKKYGINHFIKVDIPISSTEIRKGKFKYLPKEIEEDIKKFYKKKEKNG